MRKKNEMRNLGRIGHRQGRIGHAWDETGARWDESAARETRAATRYSAQADTGTQLQNRLRSPWTLSTRPTGGQYFCRTSACTGNAACSRE
jgi:hypothetical protein